MFWDKVYRIYKNRATGIKKQIRIIGLASIIGYISITLYLWAYADTTGYTFFMMGEPIKIIRYAEWIAGGIGVGVALGYFLKEITE